VEPLAADGGSHPATTAAQGAVAVTTACWRLRAPPATTAANPPGCRKSAAPKRPPPQRMGGRVTNSRRHTPIMPALDAGIFFMGHRREGSRIKSVMMISISPMVVPGLDPGIQLDSHPDFKPVHTTGS
jgi:hypothetical protein